MKLKAVVLAAMLSGGLASAQALTVVEGNVPQIDSVLVFNPCGAPVGTGTGNPVMGCLNDNHDQLVNLQSNEDLVITGGQASLTSADGAFSQLTISLVGASLASVIF